MPDVMTQTAPWPAELQAAVDELQYLPGWRVWLGSPEEDRGQGCRGLTLSVMPNHQDSYHLDRHVNTRFLYPVPAAAFNRASWEEWLWARIEETEGHERAEFFRFGPEERRPFKPLHADGWDPGVVRRAVPAEESDLPNAGRLVQFPCVACRHPHRGRMGEGFRVAEDRGCTDPDCGCGR
jgi:hypothetical protein